MSESTTPETPPSPARQPFMQCSECKAPLKGRYYALNERPLCGKCRVPYAKTIDRSEGKGAFARALTQGALVAVAGAAVLAGIVAVFPAGKIFVLVPIGWLIGKRIMTTVGNYSNRGYQKLAVGLTYLSFLSGMSIGTIKHELANAQRRSEVRVKMQGTAATQSDALNEEMKAMQRADSIEAAENGEPATDVDSASDDGTYTTGDPQLDSAIAQERARDSVLAANPPDKPMEGPGTGLLIVMFLFTPLLGMLGFGMAFSAVGVLAVGYAFLQAWKQTDGQGRDLRLSGPFTVGEGPIAAR